MEYGANAQLGTDPAVYRNAAQRNLSNIVGELGDHLTHVRQLTSCAYLIGDAVFGPVPQGVESGLKEGPPTLDSLTRQLGDALADLDKALGRL